MLGCDINSVKPDVLSTSLKINSDTFIEILDNKLLKDKNKLILKDGKAILF